MKKALVIFLVCVHLIGNTEAGQLLRLPELITHYFQHHRQNEGISFLEFIAMHYGGDDGTSADDDFDSKLPCHNINQSTLAVSYTTMLKEIIPAAHYQEFQIQYNSSLSFHFPAKHDLLILQPPRA